MSTGFSGIEFLERIGSIMWYRENVTKDGEGMETKRTAQLVIMGRKLSWKTCIIQDCYNSR